jgi:hypothetical protein
MSELIRLTDPLYDMLTNIGYMKNASLNDYNNACPMRRRQIDQLLAIGLLDWDDTKLVVAEVGRFILEVDPRAES